TKAIRPADLCSPDELLPLHDLSVTSSQYTQCALEEDAHGTTSVIYQLGRGLCRLSRKSSERPWVHRSATTMLSASCATEEEQVMNMDFRRMWRR
ncbi:hypothetical protein KUCAC02_031234, partial [Chaenocephalus aceratus]